MTDEDVNKLREVIKEEVTSAVQKEVRTAVQEELKLINKKLNKLNKLDALWDQTVRITEQLTEVQETLETHTALLNKHSEDMEKLDKRLITVEGNLGIVAPPERTITH